MLFLDVDVPDADECHSGLCGAADCSDAITLEGNELEIPSHRCLREGWKLFLCKTGSGVAKLTIAPLFTGITIRIILVNGGAIVERK